MKILSLGLLFLLFSTAGFAQVTCLDKLLPSSRYSGLHHMTRDEWNDGKDVLDAESARAALTFLTNSKLLCGPKDVVIKVEAECTSVIKDIPQSNTCFVFTNLGYFILSRDTGRNVNFIFTKDKSFSE